MRCVNCATSETKVIESRDSSDDCIRRRRECISCETRFTTYERVEKPQLVVVKNNGERQLYSREKLMAGLLRACEKTSMSTFEIEALADDIEAQLYAIGESEVPTKQVGEIVMNTLAAKNEVAYVRFASVYRRFRDIASFERELAKIRQQHEAEAK